MSPLEQESILLTHLAQTFYGFRERRLQGFAHTENPFFMLPKPSQNTRRHRDDIAIHLIDARGTSTHLRLLGRLRAITWHFNTSLPLVNLRGIAHDWPDFNFDAPVQRRWIA
jgi:hypothetical protein